jgi:superfamily II DNA or RNA helicase
MSCQERLLTDLDANLEKSYRSKHGDKNYLVREYYAPCLRNSTKMDQAVSYFTSSVLGALPFESLKAFINNNGTIRIICSVNLTKSDLEILDENCLERPRIVSEAILRELEEIYKEPNIIKHSTRVLGYLIKHKLLEIKIAFWETGLFHEKIWIFEDFQNNYVVSTGSNNGTISALVNNRESFHLFRSWADDSEQDRARTEHEYFNNCWSGGEPGLDVINFPDVAKEVLQSNAYDSTEEIQNGESSLPEVGIEIVLPPLRNYQIEVLKNWEKANHTGIVQHCTGAGKTITAISAIVKWCSIGKSALILVPRESLKEQWIEEIEKAIPSNCNVFSCDSMKRVKSNLFTALSGGLRNNFAVAISTYDMARSEEFHKQLPRDGVLVVFDEVHHLGSTMASKIMEYDADGKLGLSATPESHRDNDRTNLLYSYFKGDGPNSSAVLDPKLDIKDGIARGILSPYKYEIHPIQLETIEAEQWNRLTKEIATLRAIVEKNKFAIEEKESLKLKTFQRSSVIKTATNKINVAARILLDSNKKSKQQNLKTRWLVYCHSQEQLNQLKAEIVVLHPLIYHSEHSKSENSAALRKFMISGGIILSMKCLDEGVNIPKADHALILASSQNPREFIQRRGRVLRQVKLVEKTAVIHDLVVIPDGINAEWVDNAEFKRCYEFAESAENGIVVQTKMDELRIRFNLSIE